MDAGDVLKALGGVAVGTATGGPVGGIVGALVSLFERIIPDPAQRAAAQLQLLQLQQQGAFKDIETQLQRDLAQINVNAVEAASPSLFKSGWRPFIGWVCGVALAYEFLIRVLLGYVLSNWLHWTDPPHLDMTDLVTILGGVLGLGTLRTTEKVKGVA